MTKKLSLLFGASNALTKWLKADLPRLPLPDGSKQVGVNTLTSDNATMCWQVHIIDNRYKSYEKTIIACEANSRFIFFIPVTAPLTRDELTQQLLMKWQLMLVQTLEDNQYSPTNIARSDIAVLLSKLDDFSLTIEWVKNTDRSIGGHISDAELWVKHTLKVQETLQLPDLPTNELTIYINTTEKRVTDKATKRKEKFIPIVRLLAYCQQITSEATAAPPSKPELVNKSEKSENEFADISNVVNFSDYKNKKHLN